jgi:hypothetical protein
MNVEMNVNCDRAHNEKMLVSTEKSLLFGKFNSWRKRTRGLWAVVVDSRSCGVI